MYKEQFPLPCTHIQSLKERQKGLDSVSLRFSSWVHCHNGPSFTASVISNANQAGVTQCLAWGDRALAMFCTCIICPWALQTGTAFPQPGNNDVSLLWLHKWSHGEPASTNGMQWGNGLTSRLLTAHERINKKTTWETCGNEQERCADQEIPKCSIKFNILKFIEWTEHAVLLITGAPVHA